MNSLTNLCCDIILDYIKRISHKIQWITVQKSCQCIIFHEFIFKDALIGYDFTYIKPIDKWKALKCHHTKFEKERYSLIKDKKRRTKVEHSMLILRCKKKPYYLLYIRLLIKEEMHSPSILWWLVMTRHCITYLIWAYHALWLLLKLFVCFSM